MNKLLISLGIIVILAIGVLGFSVVSEPDTKPGEVTSFNLPEKPGHAVEGVKLISNVGASLQGSL